MEVQLLKNTSNTNSINRNFVKTKTINGFLKEGSDMLEPSILIEIDNPSDYNMMKIPSFGNRYYFIGWENVNKNMWRAYATEIDALYTYKSQILALNAIIDKQEYNNNLLIDDGSFVTQVDSVPNAINFPNGFDDNESYILVVAN